MDKDLTGNLIKGASRFAAALIFGATALVAQSAPVVGQGTWEATLEARDINGNAVALNSVDAVFYYDTVLNITWLRDWNAGASSAFDDGSSTTDGLMTWNSANAWAAALDINGYTGWRLPELSGALNTTFANTGTDSGYNVNTANSELAHMFYVTLGNLAYRDTSGSGPQSGWGLTNTAYFTNMQSSYYWFGTEYAPNPVAAWLFYTGDGRQDGATKYNVVYAVAVRPGDVLAAQAVPEPGTLGLLLAALGVGAVVRRRRAH